MKTNSIVPQTPKFETLFTQDSGSHVFSLVVITRDDPRIHECIESARHYALGTELVIVLDESPIDYVSQVKDSLQQWPSSSSVKIVRTIEHVCKGELRNLGAVTSKGSYLIFIDSDCTFDAAYIPYLQQAQAKNSVPFRTGKMLFNPKEPVTWFSRLNCNHCYEEHETLSSYIRTPNICVERETFFKTGGFPAVWHGEDFAFHQRCLLRGYSTTYDPDLVMFHQDDLRWQKTVWMWTSYGRGRAFRLKLEGAIFGRPVPLGLAFKQGKIQTKTFASKMFHLAYRIVTDAACLYGLLWYWRKTDFAQIARETVPGETVPDSI